MKPAITPEALGKVYRSNADLLLSEFGEIVESAGYRLTGGWDNKNQCPAFVPIERKNVA